MDSSALKKLRLNLGDSANIINLPDASYFADLSITKGMPKQPVNLIILFVENMAQFKQGVLDVIANNGLNIDGRLLVAYPKKGNKRYKSFVHRDEILPTLDVDDVDGYVGKSDYKFNQMVALDDTFTVVGLKRVKRGGKKDVPSQRVEDYIPFIPDIITRLSDNIKAKEAFINLTPGYQRNWARYVYSPKQQATKDKRWAEMVQTLITNPKAIK